MAKLVCGVGHNDGKYPAKTCGRIVPEYFLWRNMLARCYSGVVQTQQPAYIGCTVSENFKNYSYFHEWCQTQRGFNTLGYHLDKDLLVRGNQFYSENHCVFIPSEVNILLTKSDRARGVHPIGVFFKLKIGKYCAQLGLFGDRKHLGYFETVQEAFQAYKTAKEAHVKHMAELYKDQIDIRVYEALMAYQVEITD
jgi:hypothetical protein